MKSWLDSYPGFRTVSSNVVPEAARISKVPPLPVFDQKTCRLVVSRISTNASEIGVVDPVEYTIPVIDCNDWVPARLMVIVRSVVTL